MGHLLSSRNRSTDSVDYSYNRTMNNNNNQIARVTDEEGHLIMTAGSRISERYIVLELIGQGGFSKVASAYNLATGQVVAVKVLKRACPRFQTASREIDILQFLRRLKRKNRRYFIEYIDTFVIHEHQCIVTELLGPSLSTVLKQNPTRKLSMRLIIKLAQTLTRGLRVLKDYGIIHRDLKPDNVIFTDNYCRKLKIGDFGCGFFKGRRPRYVQQAITYRPPELLLCLPYDYDHEGDMWSLGCLLYRCHVGKPFVRGLTQERVMINIMKALGPPPRHMIYCSPVQHTYFIHGVPKYLHMDPRFVLTGVTDLEGTGQGNAYFKRVLESSNNPLFIDFIEKCLQLDPDERMTPSEALSHPWLLE